MKTQCLQRRSIFNPNPLLPVGESDFPKTVFESELVQDVINFTEKRDMFFSEYHDKCNEKNKPDENRFDKNTFNTVMDFAGHPYPAKYSNTSLSSFKPKFR